MCLYVKKEGGRGEGSNLFVSNIEIEGKGLSDIWRLEGLIFMNILKDATCFFRW